MIHLTSINLENLVCLSCSLHTVNHVLNQSTSDVNCSLCSIDRNKLTPKDPDTIDKQGINLVLNVPLFITLQAI